MTPPTSEPPKFHLRPLAARIPARTHPDTDKILAKSGEWIDQNLSFMTSPFRTAQDLHDECDRLGCFYSPDLPERWALFIVTFSHYMGAVDAEITTPASLGGSFHAARDYAGRMMADMAGWRSGPDPTLPFSTTWREFRAELPARRWARFVAACDASWNGNLRDTSATKAGERDPDFDTYLANRRDSVFTAWIFPILEHVLAPDLPEDLVTGPDMQEVHNRVLFHQALATDLFSYRKEYYNGDLINAIEVFQRTEGLSLQGAVDRLCDVTDRNEEEFLLRCEALLRNHPDRHDSLSRYLNALGSLMSAIRHWSYTCRRYHGSGSAGDGSEPGTLVLWPDRTEFRPDAP